MPEPKAKSCDFNWAFLVIFVLFLLAGIKIYELKLDADLEAKRIEVNRLENEQIKEFRIKEQEFLKEILSVISRNQ